MINSGTPVRVTSFKILIPCFFLLTAIVGAYFWHFETQQRRDSNAESGSSALAIRLGIAGRSPGASADPRANAAADAIGKLDVNVSARPCYGSLDVTEAIAADRKYLKAAGWGFDKFSMEVPDYVLLVDGPLVVGAAAVGNTRPDVVSKYGLFARHSGFSGFILASADKTKLTMLCLN